MILFCFLMLRKCYLCMNFYKLLIIFSSYTQLSGYCNMHKKIYEIKQIRFSFISKAKIIIFPNMIPHRTLGNLKDI